MYRFWLTFYRWVTQYRYRLLFLGVWITAVIIILSNTITLDSIDYYFATIKIFFTDSWWGWLLFLSLFILRPVFLVPATVLALLSGILFGLSGGLPIALAGAVISATVGYWIGRGFPIATERISFTCIKVWHQALQDRPFDTSLVMHLAMLPFDAINYFCGMLRIKFPPFLLGVAVGAIPGAFNVVLLGASIDIEQVLEGTISPSVINGWYLLAAVGIFVASQLVRRYLLQQKHPAA